MKAKYSDVFQKFIYEPSVSYETNQRRSSIYNVWIAPYFANETIYETTGEQVDLFYQQVLVRARSEKTKTKNPEIMVREVHNVLNAFYNYCLESQMYILRNPITQRTKKSIKKMKKDYLAGLPEKAPVDLVGVNRILDFFWDSPDELQVRYLATMGMRGSEDMAVDIKNMSWNENGIHVVQQTGRENGKKIIKPYTKTKEKRFIPFDPRTRALSLQAAEGKTDGLVHLAPDGSIDHQNNWSRRVYLPALKKMGMITSVTKAYPTDSALRSKRELRVAFSSYSQEMRQPLAEVSQSMGHADQQTTLKYYSRPTKSRTNNIWGERGKQILTL